MNKVIHSESPSEQDYMTIQELARRFCCSPDTIRRQMIAGKLEGIEWVDFFGNGKLRATRKSVELFESIRREATGRIYHQPLQTSRG